MWDYDNDYSFTLILWVCTYDAKPIELILQLRPLREALMFDVEK